MKKIKYLLFFLPLLFTLNVNAWTLSQPYVNYEFAYAPFPTGAYGTEATYFNTQFYVSPFLLGGVDYSDYVKSIYFSYYNTGFCAGQDISVSGTLLGTGYQSTNKLFNDESVSIVIKNNGVALSCVLNNVNGELMNYQCYGKGGGDFNLEFHLNSYHSPAQYRVGISKEIAITCDASNLDVISNATANTNAIINNQDGNTQIIINNQNQNTQDIINNQNQNTQDLIDSQLSCKNGSEYSFTNDYGLSSSGTLQSYPGARVSDFLPIPVSITPINAKYTLVRRLCFYKNKSTSNTSFISCIDNQNMTLGDKIDIPTGANYFRFTLSTGGTPNYRICYNSADAVSQAITDDSAPPTDSELSALDDLVASDTPISDLITMPLTLINSYINGISASCSSINLGNLYGTNLTLPCLNLEQRLGSDLWGKIDILFCIFMCYNIGMLFVTAFDGITSLRDDFEGLYQPRHASTGYQPKHGGD